MRTVYLVLGDKSGEIFPLAELSCSEFIPGELSKDCHHAQSMEGLQIKEEIQCSYN